ncbi:MAG: hypothetical protein HY719_07465 [Planctomycetes bacterium]|nr:hypothetical protein [Planctomycetota bacterium]
MNHWFSFLAIGLAVIVAGVGGCRAAPPAGPVTDDAGMPLMVVGEAPTAPAATLKPLHLALVRFAGDPALQLPVAARDGGMLARAGAAFDRYVQEQLAVPNLTLRRTDLLRGDEGPVELIQRQSDWYFDHGLTTRKISAARLFFHRSSASQAPPAPAAGETKAG